MADIFISYRREDAKDAAGRLLAALRAHYAAERVFMDVTTIDAGARFPDVIEAELQRCRVFLAVLGTQWLAILDQRQQEVSADYVRSETAAALQREILVIPVVIDAATVPPADRLPADIAELGRRNAQELRHRRWDDDCAALLRAIDKYLAGNPATPDNGTALPEPALAWQQWLAQARTGITRAFAHRVFDKFDEALPDWRSFGFPSALDKALSNAPTTAGRQSCEGLLLLVNAMSRVLREEDVVLTAGESRQAQERLKAAMGCAARLCLNPVLVGQIRPAARAARRCRLTAPAKEIAGSTLIYREEPAKTWVLPQTLGRAPLEDKAAIPITVELGDEASARDKLTKAMHLNIYPAVAVPQQLDDTMRARLRGENEVAALLGEARYLVLDGKDESALKPSLEQWLASELGTEILVLQAGPSSSPLFLYDEITLITLIARFLRMLNAPEWNRQ